MTTKLNLGCGYNILDGYVNIDKVQTTPQTIVGNILTLDYPDQSVAEIYLRHVIEHFFEDEIRQLLQNCQRMLQVGGYLIVETPDFERIVEAWRSGALSKQLLNWTLFGFTAHETTRERDIHMLHKYVFDVELLSTFLEEYGFAVTAVEKGVRPSNYNPQYGDFFTAMKVTACKRA
ncbi:MAG: hypothetical protein Fur0021_09050 [Candidatus Promineifilaceae bacterium]